MLKNKSHFLFGPRQTGKSMLVKHALKASVKVYNLLESDTFLMLSRSPETIRQQLTKQDKIIVIDEIQKVPKLLDEVHLMIEEFGIHFLLTGSSARALRRKGVNLLAGRARSRLLHPFIYQELDARFELGQALQIGLLPSIYFSDDPWEDLKSYVGQYLQQEIAAEAAVRNVGAFSRFLEVAALCNTKMLNFSSIANDAQVPVSTVREYFEMLKDSFMAYEVAAYKATVKRKPILTAKFYFFDIGVANYLQKRKMLAEGTPEYGEAFECYMFHEIKTYCDYHSPAIDELCYWRSKSQFEVDFIVNNQVAVEVKAKQNVTRADLKGLTALREEGLLTRYILVCKTQTKSSIDGVDIYPYQDFLRELWLDQIVHH